MANATYPPWTYGPYAFPQLDLRDLSNESQNAVDSTKGSHLDVIVPALKSSLNCSAVSPDSITVTFQASDDPSYPNLCFNSTAYEIPDCPSWNGLSPIFCTFDGTTGGVGSYFDFWVAPSFDTVSPVPEGPIFPGCPLVSVFYGQIASLNESKDVSMLLCRPFIEQVDVETTFLLPKYTVDHSHPPRDINNSAKVLRTEFISEEVVVQAVGPIYPGGSGVDFLKLNGTTHYLNPWFQALTDGSDGLPIAEIFGNKNTDTAIRGLERVFGIVMAQLANINLRNATPTTDTIPTTLPTYNAEIINPNRMRLVQSLISTRILQVLLGLIVLCAIIAFYNLDTRRVLPKNPNSIAAVTSLLAGSELLNRDIIPAGAEFRDDEFLAKRVYDGWLFSMGWWVDGSGAPRFGIDVGQYKAKDREDFVGSGDGKSMRENNEGHASSENAELLPPASDNGWRDGRDHSDAG
jgi:hypothetical protein